MNFHSLGGVGGVGGQNRKYEEFHIFFVSILKASLIGNLFPSTLHTQIHRELRAAPPACFVV